MRRLERPVRLFDRRDGLHDRLAEAKLGALLIALRDDVLLARRVDLAVLQQRLRERDLEARLQARIEAADRVVGRRPRRVPRDAPGAGAPRQPLPHAGRREPVVDVDAAVAEQEIRRRRRRCSSGRTTSRTPARTRLRSRPRARPRPRCRAGRSRDRDCARRARRTASSSVSWQRLAGGAVRLRRLRRRRRWRDLRRARCDSAPSDSCSADASCPPNVAGCHTTPPPARRRVVSLCRASAAPARAPRHSM